MTPMRLSGKDEGGECHEQPLFTMTYSTLMAHETQAHRRILLAMHGLTLYLISDSAVEVLAGRRTPCRRYR